MHSIPVWILTAVIEISLLCTGALGCVSVLLWWNQRRLRRQVIALQYALEKRPATAAPQPTPAPAMPAAEVPVEPTTPAAEDTPCAETVAEARWAVETETAAFPTPVAEAAALLAVAPLAPEPEAAPATAALSQEMLDALLAGLQEDNTGDVTNLEQDRVISEAQQSVTTMLAENVVMEQQIHDLQEKNCQLREVIDALQANAQLPIEEQQELKVPEKTMQEMEQGLAALEQTRARLLQQLQAHCQLLGLDEFGQPGTDASVDDAAWQGRGERAAVIHLQEEICHLKSTIEQQTANFQRIQEEYELSLIEYQRVFENSAGRT